MFLGGLAVVVLALQSGIGTYDDTLFWDHMIQHLMLVMVAPPLLIFGQPITLLMHASRNPLHTWVKKLIRSKPANFLTWPVFGFAAYAAAIVVAHLTGLANLTATNQAAHETEHVAFLVIGYLFFLPIIGSEPIKRKLSYPTKLLLLFLVMPVDTFTGLVLTYGNKATPGLVTGPRPAWAGTAIGDMHAGGAVMWVGGDAIMFALMMIVFLHVEHRHQHGQPRRRLAGGCPPGHGHPERPRSPPVTSTTTKNSSRPTTPISKGLRAGSGLEGKPRAKPATRRLTLSTPI